MVAMLIIMAKLIIVFKGMMSRLFLVGALTKMNYRAANEAVCIGGVTSTEIDL